MVVFFFFVQVLIAKANDFDGRPNFERFRKLFGGEKQHCE